jgi:hypothetical protein
MTFLLSEDKALRELLQGVTVTDQKAEGASTPRQVGVWFGQPDQELRTQSYPYITIDMIDVVRDFQREMRGKTSAEYLKPDSVAEGELWETDLPIPVNIDYQVTTYARHPQHDRQLLAEVVYSKLPMRFGTLKVDDTTVRRLDVLSVTKRDVTEQAKRLFSTAITVRISSEIPQRTLTKLYQVLEVHIDPPTDVNAGGRTGDPYFVGNEEIVIIPQ